MFYDLNLPWSAKDPELPRTVAFLADLGYNVVALSHTLSGKLPADLTCPIPDPLPFAVPNDVRILRRCNLVLADSAQNHRVNTLAQAYDVLAVRPVDEKTLQQACQSLDCDIISIDMTQRLGFFFKFKMLSQAIERGVKFEICYAPGIMAKDSSARRNLIMNTTQLIRASRGRGLIISSEAKSAVGCRAPWDVVNLAAVWGLGQERGHEAVSKEARAAVVSAQMKRTSFRGVIDVVYGGEKPEKKENQPKNKQESQKRKAEGMAKSSETAADQSKPPSKSQLKKQAKRARLEGTKPAQPDNEKKTTAAEPMDTS
ncbi:putative ribonuclease p complex subunit protein [Lasiodiplodia theobromae]|uniref:Putative ribonuclease P protein subunit 3 n=1 Tax=Lasiodiplodia theobromae TaxID=45133 RepID=A0A5N5DA26_9PEZI|nr:Ribonuclease p complex subunit [Lasiodiplodia theobromae]KAB2574064.1 putative ribonuclease P protein subunit 3 [Lasiodiplodia theobromae]KAF4536561.1 Ribonuclease p complex subunit [Lasiodiplodia theobromae]KAF9633695.1 putative ribonuclease p complex subunit protein [Lasiodiplodia theobromae]